MKKFYETLCIIAALLVLSTACGTWSLPVQKQEEVRQKPPSYEAVLGKPMTDTAVMDFIARNNCLPADQFHLCQEAGMALWIDPAQIVKTVYLYAGGAAGFKRYRGELPFGLTFYDPMWRVQEKLRNSNTNDRLEAAGLPEESSSPDHIHHWAIYRRFGMTVIYNVPFADEDAYIYAVVLSM